GWLKGVEVLQGAKGDGPRWVLLLTDGQANVGIVDRAPLAAMSQNASGAGVGTTTIGFGEGFDEELITEMAEAGGGHSYFAATPDDAPGIPDLARLGVEKVADVLIRYVAVGEEVAMHEVSVPVTVNLVSADEAAAADADAEVTEEVLVLRAARAEREAMKLADEGRFD